MSRVVLATLVLALVGACDDGGGGGGPDAAAAGGAGGDAGEGGQGAEGGEGGQGAEGGEGGQGGDGGAGGEGGGQGGAGGAGGAGGMIAECPPDSLPCADACVDPMTVPDHCGGCDRACADAAANSFGTTCEAGLCGCTLARGNEPLPGAICDGWCHLTSFVGCEDGCCPPLDAMTEVPVGGIRHYVFDLAEPSILSIEVQCGRGQGALVHYRPDGRVEPVETLECGEVEVIRGADRGHYGLSFEAEGGAATIGWTAEPYPVDFDVPDVATRRGADGRVQFVFRVLAEDLHDLTLTPGDGVLCSGPAQARIFDRNGLVAAVADVDECLLLMDVHWSGILSPGIHTLTLEAPVLSGDFTARLDALGIE